MTKPVQMDAPEAEARMLGFVRGKPLAVFLAKAREMTYAFGTDDPRVAEFVKLDGEIVGTRWVAFFTTTEGRAVDVTGASEAPWGFDMEPDATFVALLQMMDGYDGPILELAFPLPAYRRFVGQVADAGAITLHSTVSGRSTEFVVNSNIDAVVDVNAAALAVAGAIAQG